jgi:hypothetical protein
MATDTFLVDRTRWLSRVLPDAQFFSVSPNPLDPTMTRFEGWSPPADADIPLHAKYKHCAQFVRNYIAGGSAHQAKVVDLLKAISYFGAVEAFGTLVKSSTDARPAEDVVLYSMVYAFGKPHPPLLAMMSEMGTSITIAMQFAWAAEYVRTEVKLKPYDLAQRLKQAGYKNSQSDIVMVAKGLLADHTPDIMAIWRDAEVIGKPGGSLEVNILPHIVARLSCQTPFPIKPDAPVVAAYQSYTVRNSGLN